MPSSDPTIEVTLRSIDGLDDFPERKILLTPNATVPIGRSSKNATKKLMSGPDNAYIDSPVISREHAVLLVNTVLGIPAVFIRDNGSMHGTLVNSMALARNREHRLNNGDTVQFGMDVVRDSDSFIAKKYRFESQLAPAKPDRLFSRGFSVPDSEDEDIETEHTILRPSSRPPRYGSQSNPVNLDDFEDMPQELITLEDEDEHEHLLADPEPVSAKKVDELAQERLVSLSPEAQRYFSEEPSNRSNTSASAVRFSFVDGNSSDDGAGLLDLNEEDAKSSNSSESDVDSQDEDSLSKDDSMVNSDAESSSESEQSGDEAEEDPEAVPRLTWSEMVNHQHQKTGTNERSSAPALVSPPSIPQAISSPQTLQKLPEPPKFFHPSPAVPFATKVSTKEADPEIKTIEMASMDMFGDVYGNPSFDSMMGSPMPPRPTAPKPSFWGPPGAEFHGTFSTREPSHHNPWFEESASPGIFSMPVPDYRTESSSASSRIPGPATISSSTEEKRHRQQMSHVFDGRTPFAKSTDSHMSQGLGSATPATMSIPSPPMLTSDDMSSHTQPNRRTKVSIPEIVEETPQQPPTPTSVTSLKRKADVLDTEEAKPSEASPASTVKETAAIEVAQPKTEELPRKRVRTGFGGLVATGLASFIAGGLVAVGALASIPEGFLQ